VVVVVDAPPAPAGAPDGLRMLRHLGSAALNFAFDSTLTGNGLPVPEVFGFGIAGYPFLRMHATNESSVAAEYVTRPGPPAPAPGGPPPKPPRPKPAPAPLGNF